MRTDDLPIRAFVFGGPRDGDKLLIPRGEYHPQVVKVLDPLPPPSATDTDHVVTWTEYRVERFEIKEPIYLNLARGVTTVYVLVAPDYPRPKLQKIMGWLLAQDDPNLWQ